ncbi:MAG TPA: hypothetical protein VJB92_01565 [Candidatus Paceibacterota bacterium]
MQSRFLKQLIYGIFYLAIIFGIGYILYAPFKTPASCFDNRKNQGETEVDCGGSCLSCDLRHLKDIEISPVQIFPLQDNKLSLLFELKNPNVKYGASRFIYTVSFRDASGVESDSVWRESFIYPGELKTVVEAALDIDQSKTRSARVELSDFSWKPVSEFSLPKTQTRDIRVDIQLGEKRGTVSGIFINQNSFRLARVSISAIFSDTAGVKIGVSKTLIEDVEPFQEKNFTIAIPEGFPAVSKDLIKFAIESK